MSTFYSLLEDSGSCYSRNFYHIPAFSLEKKATKTGTDKKY